MIPAATPEASLRTGVAASLGAYLLWGFSPLFYRLVGQAPALEKLAPRVLWSCVFTLLLVIMAGRLRALAGIAVQGRLMAMLLASSLLAALNWLVFIWAVNNEKALEASLGYFLMPLVMVLLGRLFLGEALNRRQTLAVLLAALGVLNLLLALGQLPWVTLVLALSFASYGLLRKLAPVDALLGLTVGWLLLTPAAFAYLLHLRVQGELVFGTLWPGFDALLAASALMTALPLILFTAGARRLPYATVGMLSYLNPSIQFLLAVWLFSEPFGVAHLVTFALIWAGLGVFSLDALRRSPARRPARAP
ncbi:MAG: EamA family transporter RarD [Candidatus Sedimenticola endophacoides]